MAAPVLATAAIQAATSQINNVVDNLFQEKVRRGQINLLEAQAERQRFLNRLDQLDNQQKYELALRLQDTQDLNKQFEIIQNTVALIAVAGVEGVSDIYQANINVQAKNAQTAAILIGVSMLALIAVAYFVTRKKSS